MVVCHCVKGIAIDPSAIFAVNYLTHQPKIFLHLVGDLAHPLHEIKIQHVSSVETDAVDIKFGNPETDDIVYKIFHFRIPLVQFYQ